LQGLVNGANCATLSQTVCIPKFSEAVVPLRISPAYHAKEVILQSLPSLHGEVAAADVYSSIKNNIALIKKF